MTALARRSRRIAAIVSCLLAIAGCGGGRGAIAPASPAGGSTTSSVASATIQITVPASTGATTTTSSVLRHAAYVSPSTASIQLVIGGSTTTQNLSSTATNCTAATPNSPQAFTCSIPVTAPAGTTSLVATTYDGSNATGNTLSSTTLTVTFTEGAPNVIPLVLNAVPASVTIRPLPAPNPQYLVGGSSGYTLYGTDTVQVAVQAYDADNNLIIGPGSPQFSLMSSNGSLTLGGLATGTSNVFLIAAQSGFTDGTALTLTATATPQAPAALERRGADSVVQGISTAVPITLRHLLVYAPQLSNVVGVYQDRSTAASLNITSGVNGPLDVAVDQNRTVYVANNSGGNVTTYPNASATPNAATYPGLSPTGVAIDSYGSLYVSDYGSGTVKQYLAGSTTANLTISGLTLPNRTAINSFGQVAVPDSGVGKMYLYSAGSTTASTNFSVSLPHGSFYDRAGDLWIPSGTKVIELLPGVTNQNAATLTITGFISAFAVAVDIAGYIYVADYEAGKVFVLPPGATSITNATETITGLSYPGGVAVWPN